MSPSKHVTIDGVMTWDDDPTTPPIEPPIEPPPQLLADLQPTDIHYLGTHYPPEDDHDAGVRFGYSRGALTGRYNSNGDTCLIMAGATMETGWPDPVYEWIYTGVGQRGVMLNNWWDVTDGKRVSYAGNPKPIHGLHLDPATDQLWWTYHDSYNDAHDPSIGTSILSATRSWQRGARPSPRGTVEAFGPWRTQERSQRTAGYMLMLPPRLQAALGGQTMASGAPISSINAGAAWGTFLAGYRPPENDTPADTVADPHVTIETSSLIYSDIDHKQYRRPDVDGCTWSNYGKKNANGNEPQLSPVQDGRGCTIDGDLCGVDVYPGATEFYDIDEVTCGVWIEGTKKAGAVFIGQLIRTMAGYESEYAGLLHAHYWYGPSQKNYPYHYCPHGQVDTRYAQGTGPAAPTMQSSLFIYSAADILKAAKGELSPILLPPITDQFDMGQLPSSAKNRHGKSASFPSLASTAHAYGGCWYDNRQGLLFLSDIHGEWLGEWRPSVHVFAVTANAAAKAA